MFHLSYSQEDPIMFGVKFLCARSDFKCKRRGKEGKKKKKEKKKRGQNQRQNNNITELPCPKTLEFQLIGSHTWLQSQHLF